MEEIGRQLREAREARGLSLADVERETRIRQRFLEAIEAGDRATVGGDVYLRGFLRNYAAFLGMSAEPFLETLGLSGNTPIVAGGTLPTEGAQTYQPHYIEAPLRSNAFPFARVLLLLVGTVLLAALALTFWGGDGAQRSAWVERLGISLPASATPTVDAAAASATPTVTPIVAAGNGEPGEAEATTTRSARATAVPTATLPPRTPTPDPSSPTPAPEPTETPPPPTQSITLIVQVIDRAWTEIYLEGSADPVVYRTLEPGEQLEFRADQELYLRCGNSAGLQLLLNGEDLGVMGREAGLSIRRWQVNPDGGPPTLVESVDQ